MGGARNRTRPGPPHVGESAPFRDRNTASVARSSALVVPVQTLWPRRTRQRSAASKLSGWAVVQVSQRSHSISLEATRSLAALSIKPFAVSLTPKTFERNFPHSDGTPVRPWRLALTTLCRRNTSRTMETSPLSALSSPLSHGLIHHADRTVTDQKELGGCVSARRPRPN